MDNYIVNFNTWATLNESGKWIKDALPNNAANKTVKLRDLFREASKEKQEELISLGSELEKLGLKKQFSGKLSKYTTIEQVIKAAKELVKNTTKRNDFETAFKNNKLNEQDSISPMEGDSIFIVGFVSEGGIIVNAYCSEGVINKVDDSENIEVTLKEASDLGGIKDIMESSVIINKKDIITDPRGIGSTATWAAVTDNLNF